MSKPVTNVEIEDVLSSIRKLVAEESRSAHQARKSRGIGKLVLTQAQRVPDDTPAPVLLTNKVNSEAPKRPDTVLEDIPRDARLSEFGNVDGDFPDVDALEANKPLASEEGDTRRLHLSDPKPDNGADDNSASIRSARSGLSRLIEDEVAAALGTSKVEHETSDDEQSFSSEADDDDETGWSVPDVLDDDEPLDFDSFARKRSDDTDEVGTSTNDAPDHIEDASPTAADVKPLMLGTPVAEEPEPAPPQTLEEKVAALSRLVKREADDYEEDREGTDPDIAAAVADQEPWSDQAPFVEAEDEGDEVGSNVLHPENGWPQPDREVPSKSDEKSAALQGGSEQEQPEQSLDERAKSEIPQFKRSAAFTSKPSDGERPQDSSQPSPSVSSETNLLQADMREIRAAHPNLPRAEKRQAAATELGLPLDEDALRNLVVEIVRQELQGALGERITRNVRKLVRREIHRMLISQEFD